MNSFLSLNHQNSENELCNKNLLVKPNTSTNKFVKTQLENELPFFLELDTTTHYKKNGICSKITVGR